MRSGRSIPGIDESLGKEISIRLMNLATLPEQSSNSDGDMVMLSKAKRSRSSTQSKPIGAKGRMAYKMSQQSKQHEALLQTALQSGQLIPHQQQQQQHQQNLHREQLTGNSHGDQISQQQQSVPWEDRCPTRSVATTEATIPMFNAQLQGLEAFTAWTSTLKDMVNVNKSYAFRLTCGSARYIHSGYQQRVLGVFST
jgi:hypothetical protein